jgi:hypothetical protein
MKNPSFLLSESGVSRKAIPTQTKKQADVRVNRLLFSTPMFTFPKSCINIMRRLESNVKGALRQPYRNQGKDSVLAAVFSRKIKLYGAMFGICSKAGSQCASTPLPCFEILRCGLRQPDGNTQFVQLFTKRSRSRPPAVISVTVVRLCCF